MKTGVRPLRPLCYLRRICALFWSRARHASLYFVTFRTARGAAFERAVPESGEQGIAAAEAIGAFAVHPGGAGSASDAAGDRKRVEEAQLALRRPAVAANFRYSAGA